MMYRRVWGVHGSMWKGGRSKNRALGATGWQGPQAIGEQGAPSCGRRGRGGGLDDDDAGSLDGRQAGRRTGCARSLVPPSRLSSLLHDAAASPSPSARPATTTLAPTAPCKPFSSLCADSGNGSCAGRRRPLHSPPS